MNDLSLALGFPGKPQDMDGVEVDRYVQEGRIAEVSAYCETDVVTTYRIWLVFELFRGALTKDEFEASEANLIEFIRARLTVKPHLNFLLSTHLDYHTSDPVAELGRGIDTPSETA